MADHASGLLLQILDTLLFAVFDVSFEDGAAVAVAASQLTGGSSSSSSSFPHTASVSVPRGMKRTPFSTRLKHLQRAHTDVQSYRSCTDKRLASNLKSFRMVVAHATRRFMHLAFRAWKYEAKQAKKREKMHRMALRRRNHDPSHSNGNSVLVSVFYFWRSWALSNKQERLLSGEVSKLDSMLTLLKKYRRPSVP